AAHPAYSAAWAALAARALAAGGAVTAYAYARTGYHRGLDPLRRHGWRGSRPVPRSHVPDRVFLRRLTQLALAADATGEADEVARCAQFLRDCDPAAGDALANACPGRPGLTGPHPDLTPTSPRPHRAPHPGPSGPIRARPGLIRCR